MAILSPYFGLEAAHPSVWVSDWHSLGCWCHGTWWPKPQGSRATGPSLHRNGATRDEGQRLKLKSWPFWTALIFSFQAELDCAGVAHDRQTGCLRNPSRRPQSWGPVVANGRSSDVNVTKLGKVPRLTYVVAPAVWPLVKLVYEASNDLSLIEGVPQFLPSYLSGPSAIAIC